MNRNDLKEYFARLKKGQQDAFVGTTRPNKHTRVLSESLDLKQSGEHSPEEYIMKDIIGLVFDAGVAVGASQPGKGDQLAGLLEDTLGDMGLLIPPVGQKELELIKDLLSKIASGEMTDYDPNATLDYGSFEAEEDAVDALMNPDYDEDTDDDDPIRRMGFADYSQEYKDMGKSGRFYDK